MAAGATLIVGILTGIPAQLFDVDVAKDKLRSGPDLSATADIIYLDDEGRSMVTPDDYRPSKHVERLMVQPMAAVSPDFLGAIRAAGGVNLEKLTVRVIVKGLRNQEIRILDIRPVVLERTAPLGGTLFDTPPQAGAPTMRMVIDLDEVDPIAHEMGDFDYSTGEQQPGRPFFENTTISLRDREQEVLLIRAISIHHYVAFDLQIHYRIGDKDKAVIMSDRGRPFRVTGLHFGLAPNTLSYRRAFQMNSDFSLCSVTEPQRMTMYGNPPSPINSCSQRPQTVPE